jgi:hypothetical protein
MTLGNAADAPARGGLSCCRSIGAGACASLRDGPALEKAKAVARAALRPYPRNEKPGKRAGQIEVIFGAEMPTMKHLRTSASVQK